MPTVHLFDHVAGNVRSLVNAIEKVGYTVEWIKSPTDLERVDVGIVVLMLSLDNLVLKGFQETHFSRRWPLRTLPQKSGRRRIS